MTGVSPRYVLGTMPLAQVQIPPYNHKRIKAAGALIGLTLRQFVVSAASRRAEEVLSDATLRKPLCKGDKKVIQKEWKGRYRGSTGPIRDVMKYIEALPPPTGTFKKGRK